MNNSFERLFPNGLTGIIFDCDGVMIDSEDANRFFYNKVLSWLKLPPITAEQEKYSFQATANQALRKMTPEAVHPQLDEIVRKAVNYEKDILPRIKLMPGFVEFIKKAHSLGLRLAVDTNRTELGIARVLDFFSLPNYFNPVVSIANAAPKPSPEGALLICRQWQTSPDTVIFTGDSENDKLAAKGAGNVFAAFGRKGLQGDIAALDYKVFGDFIFPALEKN